MSHFGVMEVKIPTYEFWRDAVQVLTSKEGRNHAGLYHMPFPGALSKSGHLSAAPLPRGTLVPIKWKDKPSEKSRELPIMYTQGDEQASRAGPGPSTSL